MEVKKKHKGELNRRMITWLARVPLNNFIYGFYHEEV